MSHLVRVFPRKTSASPDDEFAFFGSPPDWYECENVHVSVTWKEDRALGEKLADEWRKVSASVEVGGPAYDAHGDEFVAGKYVKRGYTITSRGCPNNCWFCDVPRREGGIRELPIVDGHNVLDSNLLACSREHIEKVFKMLDRQTDPIEFTGGLEALRLKEWHVALLWNLRPKQIFFAYDEPRDYEPLVAAGRLMRQADFTRSHLRCYVLIGYKGDTTEKAFKRLIQSWDAGFLPMAMLWSGESGKTDDESWRRLQREWTRPAATKSVVRKYFSSTWINTRLE